MLYCKHVKCHQEERRGKFDARLTVKTFICERQGGMLVSALDSAPSFKLWQGCFIVF